MTVGGALLKADIVQSQKVCWKENLFKVNDWEKWRRARM